MLRNRARLNRALRSRAERAERERARAPREAAALEERTRIAGELHDVVAHALSAMIVQAAAARRLAERDPERARGAFAVVEATGREALTELRRLLGVLRREDEELALAPQPSLAHVALAGPARGRGRAAVDAARRGRAARAARRRRPDRLPASCRRRCGGARERRARGAREVRVPYAAGEVRIEVVDDGRRATAGRLLGTARARRASTAASSRRPRPTAAAGAWRPGCRWGRAREAPCGASTRACSTGRSRSLFVALAPRSARYTTDHLVGPAWLTALVAGGSSGARRLRPPHAPARARVTSGRPA